MLKLNYFLADIFILSAEKQPIKLSWRKIEWLRRFQLIIKQLKAALFFIQNFSISSSKLLDIFLKIVQMLEKFVRKITETS